MIRLEPIIRPLGTYARSVLLGAMFSSVLQFSASTTLAWWDEGHSHITVGAVAYLPHPLRSFFQTNLGEISDRSGQEPVGRHYIDIDVYQEFLDGNFPRDATDLIALYGVSFVEQNGMGPWTYANYVESLTDLMSAAKTKQDWLNLRVTAAEQAHYIEDMHNPLHLTENYNGGTTGNLGIHRRYEGEMIGRHLDELTFASAEAAYLTSVIDAVFDGIDVHYYFVDDIMAADDLAFASTGSHDSEAYYASLWAETGDFTHELFQEAAEAVANGWYTAWINAGSPIPNLGLAGDYNGNNAIDAADYTVWRDALAASSSVLVNDPTQGIVNASDYNYWKMHFGATIGGGAGAVATVPEPAAWYGLTILAGWGGCALKRRRVSSPAKRLPKSFLRPGTPASLRPARSPAKRR